MYKVMWQQTAKQFTMYQRKVDVDMLNAVKSVLADVSSVRPASEQRAIFIQEMFHLTNF